MSIRSRRLRKKLFLDEFAVFGFEFSCALSLEDENIFDATIDEFLDFLDDSDLEMGGSANQESFDGFVFAKGRYVSVTDKDLQAVKSWFNSRKIFTKIEISELVDAHEVL
ncbi:50S ribosome-binding protein YggL [Marinicellulosiphila megalodicopiae]|uniref:50S ribosome-binding protein YggL n=1 Tax=Marinicellulosiphila megalodicopiae TaxID=2724896 RepID=UPI003BB053B0